MPDRLSKLVEDINKRSNANFIRRLLQGSNRKTISDWKVSGNVATHKLSYAQTDDGIVVFPAVQEINGELHDFTDPRYKHGKWDALDSAIERGDTIRMSLEDAEAFTKNYKKYYPNFKY